jgi:ribosomal-protein-alanine N-acetyltransferase
VTRRALQLVTERLIVEIPGVSAADDMADYCRRNSGHLGPWEPARPLDYYSRAFWVRQLRAALDEFHGGQSARTVLRLRQPDDADGPRGSERIIGVANLSQIVRGAFQSAVIGYSLDREMVGRGLMGEALQRILSYAFDDMRLHRVMAAYRPENKRSAAVLERLGFEKEGFARDYLFIDGAWRDHVLTSMIRPEPDAARGGSTSADGIPRSLRSNT